MNAVQFAVFSAFATLRPSGTGISACADPQGESAVSRVFAKTVCRRGPGGRADVVRPDLANRARWPRLPPSPGARRLLEVLKSQGMAMNQQVTFLSDGGDDDVRQVQQYLSPEAEYWLGWFHITMRVTKKGAWLLVGWPSCCLLPTYCTNAPSCRSTTRSSHSHWSIAPSV